MGRSQLWACALILSLISALVVYAIDLRGNYLQEMAYRDWGYPPAPYPADEALLVYLLVWGCAGAVTATLLLLNRRLLLAFVAGRGGLLLLDLWMLGSVGRFDRKGCEECFASIVLTLFMSQAFLAALPLALLGGWIWRRCRP